MFIKPNVLQSFLMLGFLNICFGQITNFGEKVVKVAPVLWKETDHHIKSSEPTQDTLIITYLKNPCSIFKNVDEKNLLDCENSYNELIKDVIVEHCNEDSDLKQINEKTSQLKQKKIRHPRFIIASVVIIGNLLLGIETFVEFKRMQWKFQQTVEQIKSVEAEILQVLNKSMHMIRKLSDELYSFEVSTKLSQQIMKKNILLERLFQRATKNQDFSREFKYLFGDLEVCENKTCPLKLAKFKGFYLYKNILIWKII